MFYLQVLTLIKQCFSYVKLIKWQQSFTVWLKCINSQELIIKCASKQQNFTLSASFLFILLTLNDDYQAINKKNCIVCVHDFYILLMHWSQFSCKYKCTHTMHILCTATRGKNARIVFFIIMCRYSNLSRHAELQHIMYTNLWKNIISDV